MKAGIDLIPAFFIAKMASPPAPSPLRHGEGE